MISFGSQFGAVGVGVVFMLYGGESAVEQQPSSIDYTTAERRAEFTAQKRRPEYTLSERRPEYTAVKT